MKINRFEDLEIWQKSVSLAKEIYVLTTSSKFSKDFGLKEQLQRSIVSISANIAEGFDRNNNNEFLYFLKVAKSSASESRSHLYISKEIGHIKIEDYESLNNKLIEISKQIGKLIEYLKKKKLSPNNTTI